MDWDKNIIYVAILSHYLVNSCALSTFSRKYAQCMSGNNDDNEQRWLETYVVLDPNAFVLMSKYIWRQLI